MQAGNSSVLMSAQQTMGHHVTQDNIFQTTGKTNKDFCIVFVPFLYVSLVLKQFESWIFFIEPRSDITVEV